MARGFFKRMPNAMTFTTHAASATSRQTKDFVLCRSCDQRLATHGEKYVISQCADFRGSRIRFPLLVSALQRLPPIARASWGYFDGKELGIPTEKLGLLHWG